MAHQFWKDVLRPGTYHLADGRKVAFTAADCEQAHKNLQGMLRAGLNVPLAMGHQNVGPMDEGGRLAQDIRNVVGWLKDGRHDHRTGEQAVLAEVPLDEDAERLKAIRFVSPELRRDWVDGTGRKWPGLSITHVAVTAKPVQPGQRPFEPVQPVQLSSDCIWLSLDDLEPPMADDKDDKPDKGKKGKEEKPEAGGDISLIADALREIGMIIPDEVQDANGLIIAIKAGKAGGPEAETPPEGDVVVEDTGGMPVAMSMDPARNPAAAELIKERRKGLVARANKISRPDLAKKLQTCQLSLDDKLQISGGRELIELEIREDEAKKAPFKKAAARLSNDDITEEAAPVYGPAVDDEDAREEARRSAARMNGTPIKGEK